MKGRPLRLLRRQVDALENRPTGQGIIAYRGAYGVVTELHFYHDRHGTMRHLESDEPITFPLDVAADDAE